MLGRTNAIEAIVEAQSKTLNITANGTYTVTPDSGKLLNMVTTNVDVPNIITENNIAPIQEILQADTTTGLIDRTYNNLELNKVVHITMTRFNGGGTFPVGYTGLTPIKPVINTNPTGIFPLYDGWFLTTSSTVHVDCVYNGATMLVN